MARASVITEEFKAIQTALEVLEPLEQPQREFAVAMILARLGMAKAEGGLHSGNAGRGGALGTGGSAALTPAALKTMTAKDFLKLKTPATDLERFVCLAYYLTHARDTAQFTTRDITKLNSEALGPDFSNAAATATNGVKQSKFLSRAGGGKKRITTLGEAVVEALPDRQKAKEAAAAAPRRAKRKDRGKKRKPRA